MHTHDNILKTEIETQSFRCIKESYYTTVASILKYKNTCPNQIKIGTRIHNTILQN